MVIEKDCMVEVATSREPAELCGIGGDVGRLQSRRRRGRPFTHQEGALRVLRLTSSRHRPYRYPMLLKKGK